MAAGTMTERRPSGRTKSVRTPVKESINLAGVGVKPIKVYLAIPGILLIIAAACLLSKFAVIDRLAEVSAAENRVVQLRSELAAANAKLAGYDELNEKFAHYTYTGMTTEELTRVDRSEVIALIQRVVIPNAALDSWNVSGNQLTLSIVGSSLQQINLLAQQLNEETIVDFCTVRTASTTAANYQVSIEEAEADQDVAAQVIVYLTAVGEE